MSTAHLRLLELAVVAVPSQCLDALLPSCVWGLSGAKGMLAARAPPCATPLTLLAIFVSQ